jgi:hypothetical protein
MAGPYLSAELTSSTLAIPVLAEGLRSEIAGVLYEAYPQGEGGYGDHAFRIFTGQKRMNA